MAVLHPLGIRDSPMRVLGVALLVAVVVHLPLTPLPFILRWLSGHLTRSDTSWDYRDDSVIIPISLVEETDPKTAEPEPARSEPAPQADPKPAAAAPRLAKTKLPDAGAPDAREQDAAAFDEQEAGKKARASDAAGRPREAGAQAVLAFDAGTAQGDGGGSAVKDTQALAAGLSRVSNQKQNMSLLFWFTTMREHPLGPLVGTILGCNPQWREFLGDRIDPIRDLDGVWLFGPRVSDTSKLTVVVQSHMDESNLRQILAALARQPGGQPLDGGGSRAVRFHADRADRVALVHPPSTVIVTPPEGYEQLRAIRGPLTFPPARGQAMSLTMLNPSRPFRAVGAKLPDTLTEVRIGAFAAPDGGVNVQIEFDDADASAAEAHAAEVTDQIRSVGGPLLSDVEFVASGNRIGAHTHFSRITSAIVLGFFRERICPSGGLDGGRPY